MSETVQTQLENLNGTKNDFFYNTIKADLSDKYKKGLLSIILQNIYDNLLSNTDYVLTKEEFITIGGFSYIFGIDFLDQPYPKKALSEKVNAKINDILLIDGVEDSLTIREITLLAVQIITTIKEINIVPAKDILAKSSEAEIKFNDHKAREDYDGNIMKLRKIFNHSIVNVADIVIIKDIFGKATKQYKDIVTLNKLISNNVELNGNIIKDYIELYQNQAFISLLNDSVKRIEANKFSLLYFDSILSTKETYDNWSSNYFPKLANGLEIFVSLLFDFEDETAFNRIEASYREQTPETVEEEVVEKPVNESKYLSPDEKRILLDENPDKAMRVIIEESSKKSVAKTAEDFGKLILSITENLEYAQYVFPFLVKQLDSPKRVLTFAENYDFDFDTFFKIIHDKLLDYQNDYKKFVEDVCQPIPENKIDEIKIMINNIIKNLFLLDTESKQYLISQILENQISTWKHLQQIVSIIETNKVQGDKIDSYYKLYKKLSAEDTKSEYGIDVKTIFEKANNIDELTTKLRILTSFCNWYKKYDKYVPEKYTVAKEEKVENEKSDN